MTKQMTYGELYRPAMEITEQGEADAYFEKLVLQAMASFGKPREETEQAVRSNLGYYAGYGDSETRRRVERLFKCAHPVFGSIAQRGEPTADEAFGNGKAIGEG